MKLAGRLFALLLLALILPAAGFAQSSAAQPAALPKDPAKLMQLAAQRNGPEGKEIRAWYLHATWQIAAWNNDAALQGTFEEWWNGPNQYRAAYTAPHFARTLSVTASGRTATGDTQWPDPVLALIDPLLRSPLPSPSQILAMHFTDQELKIKGVSLRCAGVDSGTTSRPHLDNNTLWFLSDYCFAGELPVVRVEAAPNFQAYFNSVVLFQQRYLAESIQVFRQGLPELDIHVDDVHTIEPAPSATPEKKALETPPSHQ